ncbi:MAG: hypothetical protein WBL05_02310 [Brooklawnia sp.]|uniref:hypothetical protein n=1 Tax=Brooklawnia sp. TaxID=2699740 RepID=UPI003C784FBB
METSSEITPPPVAPTRRTVLHAAAIGTAAWVAPVVVGATAAPAAAASPPDLPDGVDIELYSISLNAKTGRGVVEFDLFGLTSWVGTATVIFALSPSGASQTVVVSSAEGLATANFGKLTTGSYTLTVSVTANVTSFVSDSGTNDGSWSLGPVVATATVTVK